MKNRWRLAVVLAIGIVSVAPALARRGPMSTMQLLYLQGAGATSTSKRMIMTTAGDSDSVVTISSVAAGVGVAYPDSLGDGVGLIIESSLGFKAYLFGNTTLNGSDTVNTTAYDSVITAKSGKHLLPLTPMPGAWKVKVKSLVDADTVTVTVVRATNWWTQ